MTANRFTNLILGVAAALGADSVAPDAATAQAVVGPGVETGRGFMSPQARLEGYEEARPGQALRFPRDHGAHEGFRTEWWYVTATLRAQDGRRFGAQWTLFRSALRPPVSPRPEPTTVRWDDAQIWMAHAAVTTAEVHLAAERFGRGGVGQAGVLSAPGRFEAWLDDWSMISSPGYAVDRLSPVTIAAAAERFAYRLRLSADRPVVLQGEDGYSLKSALGQASYYYSQPFYAVEGEVTLDGETTVVTGRAWLDREWTSQWLVEGQEGWDWLSLHIDEGPRAGSKVMLFQIRAEGGATTYAGNVIDPDGESTPLDASGIRMTPLAHTTVAGRRVPTRWRVEIPTLDVDIETTPLNSNAWMGLMTPYWEGPITFEGSHRGEGYLEMTGY